MIGALIANWKWVAMAALVAALGFQQLRVSNAKAGEAEAHQQLADARTEAAQAAQAAERAARSEEVRREEASRKVIRDAQAQTAVARADAERAAVASDGMRERLAAYVAAGRRTAPNPAPAAGSAPDAIGVLGELLGRLDDAAGRYAAEADRARIAGLACERFADSLTATN